MCINYMTLLASIADQPFHNIQKLRGSYRFPRFELSFIKMQGSPGANPASIASIKIALQDSQIPEHFFKDRGVQTGGGRFFDPAFSSRH